MILKNASQVSNPDKGTDTNQFGARTASLRSQPELALLGPGPSSKRQASSNKLDNVGFSGKKIIESEK